VPSNKSIGIRRPTLNDDKKGSPALATFRRNASNFEILILLTTLTLNLLDAFTTLTLKVTNSGIELNPVLKMLLEINPFLVYPFLLSTLIPVLLFRFNPVVEYGIATLLITIHLVASLNNFGILVSRYSVGLPTLITMDIQFLAFLTGLTIIGGYSLYQGITNRYTIIETLKKTTLNYALYLVAYFILGIIPIIWLRTFQLIYP
jgi:hypothetical protein